MSVKAAGQSSSWFLREAAAVPRVAALPSLEFKPFDPLRDSQRLDRRRRRYCDKTRRDAPLCEARAWWSMQSSVLDPACEAGAHVGVGIAGPHIQSRALFASRRRRRRQDIVLSASASIHQVAVRQRRKLRRSPCRRPSQTFPLRRSTERPFTRRRAPPACGRTACRLSARLSRSGTRSRRATSHA